MDNRVNTRYAIGVLAALLSVIVAVLMLMPLSAQADSEEGDALLVAQAGIGGGTEAGPTLIGLGDTDIDLSRLQFGDWWFELRTDEHPSIYTISSSEVVMMGGQIQTGTYLLAANSSYKFWIRKPSGGNVQTRLSITRKECKDQHNVLGTDKDSPYGLTIGKTVKSQFGTYDKQSDFNDGADYGDALTRGRSTQWFKFTTDEAGGYYLRIDNKTRPLTGGNEERLVPIKLQLQCSGGSGELAGWSREINLDSSHEATCLNLPANTTYTVRVTGNPSLSLGWPSYELTVYGGEGITGEDPANSNGGSSGGESPSKEEEENEYVFMFRLYNPNSGEHFYTASENERDYLVSLGWNNEGIGWIAPTKSNTPVYRMYNPVAGEHHYTMDASERDGLVSVGWNYESIGWYSDDSQEFPLYRDYNPNQFANNHNYTTSKDEHDWLVSLGWRWEGYSWYASFSVS